jgi:hypothetical protein
MPNERGPHELPLRVMRLGNCLSVQCIVVAAVLEFFTNPSADFELHFRRNRHITGIEQTMDVSTKENAV